MTTNKPYFLYADAASQATLADHKDKLFLVGGDFGYGGNFGDILQLKNVAETARSLDRYRVVAVMSAHAIGTPDIPEFLRRYYDVDAILFLAEMELDLRDSGLDLSLVKQVRNPAALHMYGGGFLNPMWGPFVLSVVEFLLETLRCPTYVVSGQQITPPFEHEVEKHWTKYRPQLFGVRDETSLTAMGNMGRTVDFSFDDATEALQKLTASLSLRRGKGVMLHLNISGYTANDDAFQQLCGELAMLREHSASSEGLTLVQAFNDRRPEVRDTAEVIKVLEHLFPYGDARLLVLPSLLYKKEQAYGTTDAIEARFGISCSYHVALWLQLAGIPCWLRHNNDFYSQKAQALQVTQTLPEFLAAPKLADHTHNLERRSLWQERLRSHLACAPTPQAVRDMPSSTGSQPQPFKLRAWPLHVPQDQLQRERAEHFRIRKEMLALQAHLTELGHTANTLRQQAQAAAAERDEIWRNYAAVVESRSWRLAQYLRKAATPLRRPLRPAWRLLQKLRRRL